MNQSEIQNLKLLISATCSYYGHPISDDVLKMYVEDLSDLPFDRVTIAIREARRDPKTIRFPLPAIIRAKIDPPETDELNAIEAAGRIVQAIARCGWNHPEEARAFIGELGWIVVQRDGGWLNVCQTLNEDNLGTLKAQWRGMAQVVSRRSKLGIADQAPGLPGRTPEIAFSQIAGAGFLKSIPKIKADE